MLRGNNINVVLVLILIILQLSCDNSGIKILDCGEVENSRFDICVSGHGDKITRLIIANESMDTVYFSTHSTGSLKIVNMIIYQHDGISYPASGDYFEPMDYKGYIAGHALDTLYICDTVPIKFMNYKYCIDYLIKGKKMEICVSPFQNKK